MGVYLFDRKIGAQDDCRYVRCRELVLRWDKVPEQIADILDPRHDTTVWRFPWPFDDGQPYLDRPDIDRVVETTIANIPVGAEAIGHWCDESKVKLIEIVGERMFPRRTVFKCSTCGTWFSLSASRLEHFACWLAQYALENPAFVVTLPERDRFDVLQYRIREFESIRLAGDVIGHLTPLPANPQPAAQVALELFDLPVGEVYARVRSAVKRVSLGRFELQGDGATWEFPYDHAVEYLTGRPNPYRGIAAQLLRMEIGQRLTIKGANVMRVGKNDFELDELGVVPKKVSGPLAHVGGWLIERVEGEIDGRFGSE